MLNAITLTIAIFGLLALLFSLRQTYRARLRQFEEKYVLRYWSVLDGLSLEALSLWDSYPCREDELAIRRYIILCEDELQMRRDGYISDSTYEEWADSMREHFAQPMFRKIWERVRKIGESKEPGAFPYTYLRDFLDSRDYRSGTSGDPLKMPAWLRIMRGLTGISRRF